MLLPSNSYVIIGTFPQRILVMPTKRTRSQPRASVYAIVAGPVFRPSRSFVFNDLPWRTSHAKNNFTPVPCLVSRIQEAACRERPISRRLPFHQRYRRYSIRELPTVLNISA